jgi:hypothetical protein
MKTPKKWHYSTKIGDAGLNKKPSRFKDLGEHSIKIFVREVLQNNMDAGTEFPITVGFKIYKWGKKEINAFFELIEPEHLELIRQSAMDPDPSVSSYLKECLDVIDGKRTNAFSVVVEEHKCIGLLGPIRETKNEKSHFDALMRKVENNEAKKETTNTGGTWGKGSSIFTYTSKLWTWFSYSYLSKLWEDKEKGVRHTKRLIGRCMLAPFFNEQSNTSYLGDGWFCNTEEKIDAFPYINEKADEYAKLLGLTVRQNDPGTTFLVPFFRPIMEDGVEGEKLNDVKDEFVKQVIQNWFIPIYNGLVIVNIVADGQLISINKEYLSGVPQLRFKTQILDWYSNGCPIDKRFVRESIEIEVPALQSHFINERTVFAKMRQKVKSDLIIRILDEDEDFKNDWETINKVALCRNKGMIINNEEVFQSNSLRTESILFGGLMAICETSENKSKHLDLFLAYSENPAHNTWCRTFDDYDRCFLDRFEGRRPKPEASINHLFNEIYRVFKKLLEEDIEQKENKDICSIFKKLARLKSKGDNTGGKALFSMRTVEEPEIDSEGRYIFTKRVISNDGENRIEVGFKSFIESLEGEKDKDFELLGIKDFTELEIMNDSEEIISAGNNPKIELDPSDEIIVKIRTCVIDRNPFFKNVEPFIKASAKLISHE